MNTVDLRCPSCGALARGDASWCTLCHADLRPPQAPPEQPPLAPGTPSAVAGLDPLTAPLSDLLAAVDADAAASAGPVDAVRPEDLTLLPPPAPQQDPAPPAADEPATSPAVSIEQALAQFPDLPPALALAAAEALAGVAADSTNGVPAAATATAATAGTAQPRANATDDAELSTITDTEVMFALLRGQGQDPLLAKYGGQLGSKSSRFAVMVVGAGALAVLFFGAMALLGLVFG